jgi:hypothetical protein
VKSKRCIANSPYEQSVLVEARMRGASFGVFEAHVGASGLEMGSGLK